MASLASSPSVISLESKPRGQPAPGDSDCYIFFITGNPGLIAYYEPFLSTLSSLLSMSRTTFQIRGHSLAGFEGPERASTGQDEECKEHPPFSLQRQIEKTAEKLYAVVGRRGPEGNTLEGRETLPRVILIGHSVGAYILLELLRLHRVSDRDKRLQIIGGVLLFPTVTHIAQSPSGLKFSRLFRIPRFPLIAGSVVRVLVRLVPRVILSRVVKLVTRFPPHALRATIRFTTSPTGVQQALYMANDEMNTITEDRWDEDVWGAARASTNGAEPGPKLYFYFGKEDHWVADHTRDDLIAARGNLHGSEGEADAHKPKMFIDEDKIPHGFCINHSEVVAEKVKLWIEEMVDSGEI